MARADDPGSGRAFSVAANPLVADPGPEFDQEAGDQPQPPPVSPLHALEVSWQPDRVRTILRAQGLLTHEAVGVGVEDWVWRDSELSAISEPAANVLNKHPVTHAAAAVSDELTVGAVMFEYAARSIRERAQVLRTRRAAAQQRQAEPLTGRGAEGEPVAWRNPGE